MFNSSPESSNLRRLLPWGIALVGVAIATVPLLPQTAHAQSTSGDAADLGEWQTNERDTRSIGSTGLTPLELIQQIQGLSGQSQSEFNSRQEGRLNDAAESFRQQQQQQLGSPS
ncbi:MAG: hypothetical protein AAGF75_02785, partial [Cyanobacteria bacterium P01_H01_bin.130]